MGLSDHLKHAVESAREILRPRDAHFQDLLSEQATCAASAGVILLAYLDRPAPDRAQAIADLEERGDQILSNIQRALREALVTPLSGSDINYLGNAIDDLLDQFEDMISEDAALEAAGVGTEAYDEASYQGLLRALGEAFDLLPRAVADLFRDASRAQETIAMMRAAYNEGKRAYSLAYAELLARGTHESGFSRTENRLRWLRLHLRRVEKLTNAIAGILANN